MYSTEFLNTHFVLKYSTLISSKKLQSHFFTVAETLNSKSQTKISVIRSQNQQQSIASIQQLFQHSLQLECSPADVGSNERRSNLWSCLQQACFASSCCYSIYTLTMWYCRILLNFKNVLKFMNFTEF